MSLSTLQHTLDTILQRLEHLENRDLHVGHTFPNNPPVTYPAQRQGTALYSEVVKRNTDLEQPHLLVNDSHHPLVQGMHPNYNWKQRVAPHNLVTNKNAMHGGPLDYTHRETGFPYNNNPELNGITRSRAHQDPRPWPHGIPRTGPLPTVFMDHAGHFHRTKPNRAPLLPPPLPNHHNTNTEPASRTATSPRISHLVKAVTKAIMVDRHLNHWARTPPSIRKAFQLTLNSINLVGSDTDTMNKLSSALDNFLLEINQIARNHLYQQSVKLQSIIEEGPLEALSTIRNISLKELKLRRLKSLKEDHLLGLIDAKLLLLGKSGNHHTRGKETTSRAVKPTQSTMNANRTQRSTNLEPTLPSSVQEPTQLSGLQPHPLPQRERAISPQPSFVIPHNNKRAHQAAALQPSCVASPLKDMSSPLPPPVITFQKDSTPRTRPPPGPQATSGGSSLSDKRLYVHGNKIPDGRTDWGVQITSECKTLVLADSNMRHLPLNFIPRDWNLNVYPGMLFQDVTDLLKRIDTSKIENLIIWVGINHKTKEWADWVEEPFKQLSESLSNTLCNTYLVEVPVCDLWPKPWCDHINLMNTNFRASPFVDTIPLPTVLTFSVDQHHLVLDSVVSVWNLITQHINHLKN